MNSYILESRVAFPSPSYWSVTGFPFQHSSIRTSDYSSDEPTWRQKQIRKRTVARNISFTPSPDQVQEAIAWVKDNAGWCCGMEESCRPLHGMAQQRAHISSCKLFDSRELFCSVVNFLDNVH